jgi:hypothetical protein
VLVTNIQTGFVTVPNQDIQGTGNIIFSNGGVGGNQVFGIFYDIFATGATTATGGVLDLFWADSGTIDMSAANPDLTTVTRFTTGTPLARINFASGIRGGVGDCATTIASSVQPQNTTVNGLADSFGNVNVGYGGAWAAALNRDWFIPDGNCGTRDIRFSNFFNGNPQWDTDGAGPIVGLRSNDPARAFTVPEPTSLTLLGLGLAGLVRMRRRVKA